MIGEGENQALLWLLVAIAVFLTLVIGTIVASQLKKAKKEHAAELEKLAKVDTTVHEPLKTPVTHPVPSVVSPSGKPSEMDADVDLRVALRRTEEGLFGRLRGLFKASGSPALEDVEEILYTGDLGPATVQKLMGGLEENLSSSQKKDYSAIREDLRSQMLGFFDESAVPELRRAALGPSVYMIVGVNGAGKTTTIGKLSAQAAEHGKKVLVAAGDTFRAAASAQLRTWTDRAQVDIFSPEGVTDPGAVAFDAVTKAAAQGFDVVLIDTAGRLHTQAPLMEELKKVKRVIEKALPGAPHEIIIVLDANSGQNALQQAKEFNKAVGLTGAILTKMDGTAKGGVALALAVEMQLPVRMIGVGERIRDLRPFHPAEYVDSILGEP